MNNYQKIISNLASNDYYMIKDELNLLINNKNFINEIVKVDNPFVFDHFIKMVEYKIDAAKIYEERNKYIKKVLLNIDINKHDNNKIPNRWIIEYIVGYYFQDNYYNFMTNFYQMLTYLQVTKKNLVDKLNINLYKEFVNLRSMSLYDKIGFFKLLLDNDNIMGRFYDDISKIRSDSHKQLVDNIINLKTRREIYNNDLSKKHHIDVYYLNGESFYGLVRCLSIKRNDLTNQSDLIYSMKKQLGYSFSYISNNNIGTIDYSGENVVLFYDSIDYKNIMYVHHGDLHAKKMALQEDYLSIKENEILTPEALIARTNSYNEIYIKSDENGIRPTALVCYDSIKDDDVLFAKKYQLPILLINRKKYKQYETFDDNYDDFNYCI